jgi:hypothetical protein
LFRSWIGFEAMLLTNGTLPARDREPAAFALNALNVQPEH